MEKIKIISATTKIIKYLYVFLIVIFAVSFFKTKNLPERDVLLPELKNEPIQSASTERSDFNFDYREKKYHVKPLADYELWGLVVSVNNINTWYNYYHDENSVNLKDVCVIWGDNLASDAYHKVDYKSGEWTCYFRWQGDIGGRFYPNKLSNNHLLSDNPAVREIIRDVRVGDQIRLKGALVDYAEGGQSWYRKSSLSRDDSNHSSRSGGACEVFFVDEVEILAEGNVVWNAVKHWSKILFIFLLGLQFLLFFLW